MKNVIPLTLALPLLLAAPIGISACATTQTMGEQTADGKIKRRIGRSLTADPAVNRFDIDVDVLDRVVTLRGKVDDQRAAEQAVLIAQNTKGVERVISKLEVGDGDDYMGRSDSGIKAAVGTRLLADPDVRRVNIDVDVQDGVVTLSGIVHDQEAKQAAERIATNVDGVVRVENELQIGSADDR